MKKDIKRFIKTLENLLNLIQKNKICFENYNYKLYNLSYDLWKNENNIFIKNLSENAFYKYCDDMYSMFEEDFSEKNFSVNINEYGRTSSRFLTTNMIERYNNNLIFKYYNENDFSLLLSLYNNDGYIVDDIKELIEDLKAGKIYKLLKHCINEGVNIENLFDDIINVKSEILEIIKAYYYIQQYKNNIENINNFLEYQYFYNIILDTEKLKKFHMQKVPCSFIDSLFDEDFLIFKAGKYYKIYTSYAAQPIILKLSNNIIK